jgi:leucyl-tRNA synthetase
MKKVMPFVAMVSDRVEALGKIAMAVTVDFDELEIINLNLEYLKTTLDLEGLEVKFTDSDSASEKIKEEVRPGNPFIVYTTKPSIKITLENPVPRSGMFTEYLNVSDGDSTLILREKLTKSLGLKEVAAVQLWRYADPILGPRKIPAFNDYKSGKIQLEDGNVSIDLKTQAVYITTTDGKKIDVGTSFVYIVA